MEKITNAFNGAYKLLPAANKAFLFPRDPSKAPTIYLLAYNKGVHLDNKSFIVAQFPQVLRNVEMLVICTAKCNI